MSSVQQQLNIHLSNTEVENLWLVYGTRLRMIARRFLGAGRRIEDSEGIANAAFLSLVKQVSTEDGLVEDSSDRDALWPLAFGIARNKALQANRRASTITKGGCAECQPADGVQDKGAEDPALLAQLEELIIKLDEYTANTPLVRQIVERRLLGQTSKEIAEVLGVSQSMVSRRLAELRRFMEEC